MLTVKRTADRNEIRRRLNTDRIWSIYALADLDAGLYEHCQWWICGGSGLALLFQGIPILPVFLLGNEAEVRALLEELPVERGYLNLRDWDLPAADGLYSYEGSAHRMRRMVLDAFRSRAGSEAFVLGPENAEEIRGLYASGDGGGIAFGTFQLATGFFRGVRRSGALVAVAGVHVVSPAEGVAGVGNIFTREDWRGHGLAQLTASAVVEALLEAGIATIGLNVEINNVAAIAAYERIGFCREFEYTEGTAVRVRSGKGIG